MIKINALKILFSCSLLLLFACSGGDNKTDIANTEYIYVDSDIKVRATNDFETPSKVTKATFVPNIIAGWATQLVMIDETGALLRTQMDRPVPEKFSDGPFTDIQGFGRKGQPGILLALSEIGRLQAFIEVSDDGDLKRIPVSQPNIAVKAFCQTSDFTAPTLQIQSAKGKTVSLDISVENNTQLILSLSKDNKAPKSSCAKDSVPLDASLNKSLTPNPTGPHLIFKSGPETNVLEISDGLSIQGIADPDIIAITDANLGSTFNKGALLVTDANSNRIVLIARDYLIDVLEAPAQ